MDRVTLYDGQVPKLEDILNQEKYVMRALSSVLASVITSKASYTSPYGLWLPGPHTISSGDFYQGIKYLTTTNPPNVDDHGITIYAPLALVQPVIPDATAWSTLGTDSVPLNVVGRLQGNVTFDCAADCPLVGGQPSESKVIIAGKVVIQDSTPEPTPFFNPPDPTVAFYPVGGKSRYRQAILQLNKLVGGPVLAVGEHPTPANPTVPAGYTPLLTFFLQNESGFPSPTVEIADDQITPTGPAYITPPTRNLAVSFSSFGYNYLWLPVGDNAGNPCTFLVQWGIHTIIPTPTANSDWSQLIVLPIPFPTVKLFVITFAVGSNVPGMVASWATGLEAEPLAKMAFAGTSNAFASDKFGWLAVGY